MENDKFDEILNQLKKQAAENRGEDPAGAEGTSMRHLTRIQKFLEEDGNEDIILSYSDNEQYLISRAEQYACVCTDHLTVHYVFNEDFSAIEEQRIT